MGTIKKKIDGNDLMLFNSEGKSWAWATNHSLTFSIDTLEILSKDCPRYPFVERGKMSVEITSENLFCEEFDDLFEIMMAKTPITLKFGIKKNEGDKYVSEGDLASWEIDGYQDYFTGKFIVTSLEASAATGEKAIYSVTFQSVGKIKQENDYLKITTKNNTSVQTKRNEHIMQYEFDSEQINYVSMYFAENATVTVGENYTTVATVNEQVDTTFNMWVAQDGYATIPYIKVDYTVSDGENDIKLSQKVQQDENITVIAPSASYTVTIENITVYYTYNAPTVVSFNSLDAANITNTAPNQTYFVWWMDNTGTSISIVMQQSTQQAPIWTYDETEKSLTIKEVGWGVRLKFTSSWRSPSVDAKTFDIHYYDITNDVDVTETYETGKEIDFNSHQIKIYNVIMYYDLPR